MEKKEGTEEAEATFSTWRVCVTFRYSHFNRREASNSTCTGSTCPRRQGQEFFTINKGPSIGNGRPRVSPTPLSILTLATSTCSFDTCH